MSLAETMTPLATRVAPTFRYQRLPTQVMPDPIIPDGVLPPQPGIHELFAVRIATDDQVERDAFAVRWQVYCGEFGYEMPATEPSGLERDRHDQRAVQVVAYYRATGMPVGTFRLLLADPERLAAPFQLEELCPRIDRALLPVTGEPRLGYTELSRFCITAPFRRFSRCHDTAPEGVDRERWRAEAPHRLNLAALMWLSAAHLAVHLRLDYILALMEPRLRLLARSVGFTFSPIGEAIELHGQRLPHRIDRRALRALLQVPQTAQLLAPVTAAWEAQAAQHPLLPSYIAARPVPHSQRIGAQR